MLPRWVQRHQLQLATVAFAIYNLFPNQDGRSLRTFVRRLRRAAARTFVALTGFITQGCPHTDIINRMVIDMGTEVIVHKTVMLPHFPSPMPTFHLSSTEVIIWIAFRVYWPMMGDSQLPHVQLCPLILNLADLVASGDEVDVDTALCLLMAKAAEYGIEDTSQGCECNP